MTLVAQKVMPDIFFRREVAIRNEKESLEYWPLAGSDVNRPKGGTPNYFR